MIHRKLVLLVFPALVATDFSANAQVSGSDDAATCEARLKQKQKKKRLGFGGLTSAAKRAGVGKVLGSLSMSEGDKRAEVAVTGL